jgi:hypothetical protein
MNTLVLDTLCVLALAFFLYVLAVWTAENRRMGSRRASQTRLDNNVRRLTSHVRNLATRGEILTMPSGKRHGHRPGHPGKYVA